MEHGSGFVFSKYDRCLTATEPVCTDYVLNTHTHKTATSVRPVALRNEGNEAKKKLTLCQIYCVTATLTASGQLFSYIALLNYFRHISGIYTTYYFDLGLYNYVLLG